MIVENIVAALIADSTLHSYIEDRIFPEVAKESDVPCIVYSFTPTFDNRIDAVKDRLEIRVICKSLTTLYAVDKRVRQILLTIGDAPSSTVAGMLKATITGGTKLYDILTDATQQITFYEILSRRD